jgi:ABC-type dipeptide/oligopeptide/nickel transport system ATPase component/ABC-type amino acid transport system permease subunit
MSAAGVDDVIQYLYTTLSSIPGVLLIAAAVLMMQVIIDTHPDWFATSAERADARLLALCLILGMTSWTSVARLLRGETLKLRELEFVQAAQAFGVGRFAIMRRHILPNLMHIVLIALVMDFSGLVLAEAVLSYVGVGVDPTTISFGTMINTARMELAREPMVWWSLAAAFSFMFAPGAGRQPVRRCRARRLRSEVLGVIAGREKGEGGRVVLAVRDLSIRIPQGDLLRGVGTARPVDGISFDIAAGECFALLGESGCGKSMTALGLMRLLPAAAQVHGGSVEFEGRELLALPEADMREVRGGGIGMIFQEPATSLNPVLTVGSQIVEALELHAAMRGEAARARAEELLDQVGIPDPKRRLDEYPFQLSGGLRQRVMIAIALAGSPRLLIADEPTTALDVTIQAQVLDLLDDLRRKQGMALLLITHDLGVVARMADRVGVMYAGQLVEDAPRSAFFPPSRPSLLRALVRRATRCRPARRPAGDDSRQRAVGRCRAWRLPLRRALRRSHAGVPQPGAALARGCRQPARALPPRRAGARRCFGTRTAARRYLPLRRNPCSMSGGSRCIFRSGAASCSAPSVP